MAQAKKKQADQIREAKVVKTPDEEFENNSDVEFIGDDSMLIPNDGESLDQEDEEEQQELSEDQAMFGGNEALVQAVFEWMDAEIKDCDSIQAAHAIATKYKKPLDDVLIAMDLVRIIFEMKRVAFQNVYDTLKEKSN